MVSAPGHGADPPDGGPTGAAGTADLGAPPDGLDQDRPGLPPTVREAAGLPFWWRWGYEPAADAGPTPTAGHEPSGDPGLMP